MKSTLLFLFAVLQAGFLSAQAEQFDPNYFGEYRTDSGDEFYYFVQYDGDLDQFLTEEQQKKVAFFFSYHGPTEMISGVAMKNGNTYASLVNEATPELTFAFTNENNLPAVVVTDKSGNKLSLTKFNFESDYSDEETMDEPSIMRVYSRSDGADLAVIFTEKTFMFGVHIPATKSCVELQIEDDLVRGGEEGLYIYNDPEGKYVLHLFEMENTMQFVCAEGDCFDPKSTCGIWKEVFIFKN